MAVSFPTIGALTFQTVFGEPSVAADELTEVTRTGVDGIAYKKRGARGMATSHLCIAHVETQLAVVALKNTVALMVGTVVSVAIGGQTRGNYLVLNAGDWRPRRAVTMSGGVETDGTTPVSFANGYEVGVVLTLRPT